ncbi:MAG: hypothetical protein JW776_03635 [Candidatus Lokiarchaeota archaeon]|nr:hypothetical protein [Candidatus Lokiarchaeota archaeon]
MVSGLHDLSESQNIRIREILKKTELIDLESLSSDICRIEKSKKNLVLSIIPDNQNAFVLKLFDSSGSLENEMKIYTMRNEHIFYRGEGPHMTEYAIPKLILGDHDYIITEYIQGENVMDLITENMEGPWNPSFWEYLISILFNWVINFSSVFKTVPLDCHVRNFLLKNMVLYGVDFEELGNHDEQTILKVFATMYFSIIGSYPGVIEGLELHKNANIGIILLRLILLSPIFKEQSLQSVLMSFFENVEKEASEVVQRRIKLQRGKKYDLSEIKKNVQTVLSTIKSDFS